LGVLFDLIVELWLGGVAHLESQLFGQIIFITHGAAAYILKL